MNKNTLLAMAALAASGCVTCATADELKAKTTEFKERLAKGETLDDLLPEAFAT